MESPYVPPSARPDALDALEQRVRDLIGERGDAEAWDAVVAQIERAALFRDPPPIDRRAARISSCELSRLVEALRGAPPELPASRTRAGYALEAGEAHVLPAFAAALGAPGSLRDTFPDLWAVDAALWARLDHADRAELARTWLESPGRRLVQDIGALRHAPGTLGAADLSRERLSRAVGVGVPFLDDGSAFHELHGAIPGEMLAAWRPHTEGEPVVRALKLLEEGSPVCLRGAALTWLLDRAAGDPFYAVDGVAHELREDLPVRLGVALGSWLGRDREITVAREIETFSLLHAARIIADDTSPAATREAWSTARWLQRCITLSPFHGSDEELLAAHLRSLLSGPIPVPEGADALHPARFALDEKGLDIAEIAFLSGVLAHYLHAPAPVLLPTPVPIVNALIAVARRPVRPAEEAADTARAAGRNALGWPEGYPLAAPLAARKLMTELRIGWVSSVGEEAQLESIEYFARAPREHAWVAFALHRESLHIGEKAMLRAAEVFRANASDPRVLLDEADLHLHATMGASVLELLDSGWAKRALDLADRADLAWRPFIADALVGAAQRHGREDVWGDAMKRLLALMEDGKLDDKTRLNAALFALRRAAETKFASRDALLARVVSVASWAPFTDHAGLRREIRRLSPPLAAGGKR